MAESKPEAPRRDFLQTLRDSFDQVERQLNALLSDRSSREDAGALRARIQQFGLDMQKRNWERWASYFQTINLPTRTDFIRIGKRLVEMEHALGRIEAQLRSIEQRLPDAPEKPAPRAQTTPRSGDATRPRRTRKPPTRAPQKESS